MATELRKTCGDDRCDRHGCGAEPSVGEVIEWLQERGAIDHEAAAGALVSVQVIPRPGDNTPRQMFVRIASAVVDAALGSNE